MVRNKYIIFPFLFLAWTIIFAHSIVPHHHHSENLTHKCNHTHLHETFLLENSENFNCDHDCDAQVCHFHVEILTQVSVDQVFIASSEIKLFEYFSSLGTTNFEDLAEFIDNPFLVNNHLRAPPQIA